MFTITFETIGSIISVLPEGRLDTINSSVFNEEIGHHLEKEQYLIIDFSRCNYLASSGIRSLLAADKKLRAKGGQLFLASMPSEVFQVFEISGLHHVFASFVSACEAREEIAGLKRSTEVSYDVSVDDIRFFVVQRSGRGKGLSEWTNCGIAGLNELGFSVGTGSLAESLMPGPDSNGVFVTLSNCTGFLPYHLGHAPEFRVYTDASAGGVFVDRAVSAGTGSEYRLSLPEHQSVELGKLMDAVLHIPEMTGIGRIRLMAFAGRTAGNTSLSLILAGENGPTGATFCLDGPAEAGIGDSLDEFGRKSLTLENIGGLEPLDLFRNLVDPTIWIFAGNDTGNANEERIKVMMFDGSDLEPWKAFLARRLYTDSLKLIIKPLHGGYSAQTFQVESFDLEGRKLRPTVLKIAGRDLINREGDRCQRYAMPYILNNSAIILGTSFYCNMGALRYNFVGIGGDESRLEWLTLYFNTWTADRLGPLFDKIFLQILKPWYGQPVKKHIHPYLDHDPTQTFFKNLCETAESELKIPANQKHYLFKETGEEPINPYWFLKHEWPARREESIDYYSAICHGDLNMQNILLDADMNVYLIDFSETGPRSAISDFARLEAIFMIQHAPLNDDEDLKAMMQFAAEFYAIESLAEVPDIKWVGRDPEIMQRNISLVLKMRRYALDCVAGDPRIVPYYLALLEWVLPIVCYGSVDKRVKRLSAYVSGKLCSKIDGLG